MSKIKLTERLIKSLKLNDKAYNVFDTVQPYLYIRITNSSKTYMFYKRNKNIQKRSTLGNVHEMTLKQARFKVVEILEQLKKLNEYENKGITFKTFEQEYFNKKVTKWGTDTQKMYKYYMNKRILTYFHKMHLKDILFKDVYQWFHLNSKDKKGATNTCFRMLKTMFNVAIEWEYMTENPAVGIKQNKPKKMIEFLSYEDIKRIGEYFSNWKRYCNESDIKSINIISLLLVTGCRLNEIQSIKWEYIKKDSIEFPHTKTGHKTIVLNPTMKTILSKMGIRTNSQKKGYIFTNTTNKYGYHIVTGDFWRRHRDNLGLPRIRLHDIRHTYITLSIQKGINLLTVLLNDP